MAAAALDLMRLPADRCLMTGDRLETDIAMGQRAGMDTALGLTGAPDPQAAAQSAQQPTYILEQLDGLLPYVAASETPAGEK